MRRSPPRSLRIWATVSRPSLHRTRPQLCFLHWLDIPRMKVSRDGIQSSRRARALRTKSLVDPDRSSQQFWLTVDITQTIALKKGGDANSFNSFVVSGFASNDSSKQLIQAVGMPSGYTTATKTYWLTNILKGILGKLWRIHITLDMKNGMVPVLHVHVRLQLPRLTGALWTPWVNVLSAQLNGTPVPLWSTNSKEVRAYALP